jgi:hypothetical protein
VKTSHEEVMVQTQFVFNVQGSLDFKKNDPIHFFIGSYVQFQLTKTSLKIPKR